MGKENTFNTGGTVSQYDGYDEDNPEFGLPRNTAEGLVSVTEERVSDLMSTCPYLKRYARLIDLPLFSRDDLILGPVLAKGGFAYIVEVRAFTTGCELNEDENEFNQYVVKYLHPKLLFNHQKLATATRDLVMESKFLSALKHPHILQLRGMTAAGVASFLQTGRIDGFFLVLDRLETTLAKRIHEWRHLCFPGRGRRRSSNGNTHGSIPSSDGTGSVSGVSAAAAAPAPLKSPPEAMINVDKGIDSCSAETLELYASRMEMSIDIASALVYLHSNRIMHRDLKPTNVGFNKEGVLKIFDFGLAVELPPSDNPNQLYQLSNKAGTSRYMAPEVIKEKPHNCKSDVYSFSILVWELLALEKPYDGIEGVDVMEIVANKGTRPNVPSTWPRQLQRMFKYGWAKKIDDRPTMVEMKNQMMELLEDPDQKIDPRKRLVKFFHRRASR